MIKKKQKFDQKRNTINRFQEEKPTEKMVYFKLKLPIKKISKESENSINEKIKKNIINPKISFATSKDIPNIVKLYNRSWLTSNTPFSLITTEQLEDLFYNPKFIFLIAKVYGIDAGFVILGYEGLNNEYGMIDGLGIEPRFQRKGIGIALGFAVWNLFKQNHVKELRCEIYYKNRASLNFVKSLGFEIYDVSVDFIYDKETYSSEEERNI
ncbi:MAG: GNAT family N-acetyltransferase [Promethearchaeota archaeon]